MSRILVIDDDTRITQMCKVYFTAKGHQVTVANSGKEGLSKFKNGEFDLVMTDLMMPEIHGFHIVDYVKSSGRGAQIPVILVTADKDDPDLVNYQRSKVQDDTLSKPFDIPLLERKINRLLEEFANKKI